MSKWDLVRAWGRILGGTRPSLSLEITRECPLRCPGCYAYEPEHLGTAGPLRSLADHRDQDLIDRVLALVDRERPIHVSIVGGEPLVRFRELDVILPALSRRSVLTQVVTSAVRPIPAAWKEISRLWISVSVDGLQPEHDRRRAPATYERILANIAGHEVTVHCTVTAQMARDPGAFREFLAFWSARPEVARVWFSLFTPQVGQSPPELLSPADREHVIEELASLRRDFPKLALPDAVLAGYRRPPAAPEDCLFARTTTCITADLRTRITPCQFGGTPDCSQCGCMASAGLKYIGDWRLAGLVPLRAIHAASERIGRARKAWSRPVISPGADTALDTPRSPEAP